MEKKKKKKRKLKEMLKLNLENKEILNLDVIFLRNWPRPEDHFTYLANPRILVKYDNKKNYLNGFVFPTLKKKNYFIYIYTHTILKNVL